MKKRVVITGLGVVAPNGIGVTKFTDALKNGISGITFHQELKDLNFSCQIGGIPNISDELKSKYFTDLQLRGFNSSGILYGCIAGIDAWKDAGFDVNQDSKLDYDSGLVLALELQELRNFVRQSTSWTRVMLDAWVAQ